MILVVSTDEHQTNHPNRESKLVRIEMLETCISKRAVIASMNYRNKKLLQALTPQNQTAGSHLDSGRFESGLTTHRHLLPTKRPISLMANSRLFPNRGMEDQCYLRNRSNAPIRK